MTNVYMNQGARCLLDKPTIASNLRPTYGTFELEFQQTETLYREQLPRVNNLCQVRHYADHAQRPL